MTAFESCEETSASWLDTLDTDAACRLVSAAVFETSLELAEAFSLASVGRRHNLGDLLRRRRLLLDSRRDGAGESLDLGDLARNGLDGARCRAGRAFG